jgi:hypothetical protein
MIYNLTILGGGTLDYGRLILCAILAIYFIVQFVKSRKVFDLVMVFIFAVGAIYAGSYNLYQNLSDNVRVSVNTGFSIFGILIIVYAIIKKKRCL